MGPATDWSRRASIGGRRNRLVRRGSMATLSASPVSKNNTSCNLWSWKKGISTFFFVFYFLFRQTFFCAKFLWGFWLMALVKQFSMNWTTHFLSFWIEPLLFPYRVRTLVWIGLKKEKFEWVDGKGLDYAYWQSNQPNDYTSTGAHTYMSKGHNWRWYDVSGTNTDKYVSLCKMPKPASGKKIKKKTPQNLLFIPFDLWKQKEVSNCLCWGWAKFQNFFMLFLGDCPDASYWSWSDYCYRLQPVLVSFEESEALCASQGSYLANVHSASEMTYLRNQLSR